MTRGRRARARAASLPEPAPTRPQLTPDEWRGRSAWWMPVSDVLLGGLFGFSYPMDGDRRPDPHGRPRP